jgi:membrane protein DedA with SNARE-associated domain
LKDNNENIGFQWSKFAGLASQWAITLVCLLFLGKYLDQKHYITFSKPLFIWLLPFAFILFSLINIVKETNKKNK